MITPEALAALLGEGRFDLSNEAACQAEIETFLAARLPMGCALQREFVLGPSERPDFMVDGRLLVEVKVHGAQRRAIERQLMRYADYRDVEALILATNVSMRMHRAPAFRRIGPGKSLFYVPLGRAWM